jgi:chaperone required for assembly of F1-ATPase
MTKRFYREVTLGKQDDGYSILLDGKPVKTPLGRTLVLPQRTVADAIAEEWRAQGENIRPATMLLTKLANTALDCVAEDPREAANQILAFAKSDLVCYRAESPAELVARQRETWDSLLDWLTATHDSNLKTGTGIAFIEQPEDAIQALERVIASRNAFELAGLQNATALLGSAVIALALADERLEPEAAFAAAQLDAIFQAERWGRDSEAESVSANTLSELVETVRFLRLLHI